MINVFSRTFNSTLSLPIEQSWDAISVSGEPAPPAGEGKMPWELILGSGAGLVLIGGIYYGTKKK